MATANVEYPRSLAHCPDPIIRAQLLVSPVYNLGPRARLWARHCAIPQGNRYTGVRDRIPPKECRRGYVPGQCIELEGGGVANRKAFQGRFSSNVHT